MIVLDETKKVFAIIRDPRKANCGAMSLTESLLFAYKATILADLIGFVVTIFLGTNLASATAAGLVGWLVFAVVEIFAGAAIFHLVGKYVFRKFNSGFKNTVASVAYAYSAMQWLTLIASMVGIVLAEATMIGLVYSIFEFIALIYGFAVLVSMLSRMQHTKAIYAFGSVVLIPLVIIIAYVFLNALASHGSIAANSTTSNIFTGNVTK